MFFSYGIKIWTDLSFVLSQYTRVTDRRTDGRTDGQTDRNLITIPRLHYMQRGKKLDSLHCIFFADSMSLSLTTFV